MDDSILFEINEGIGILTVNRPKSRNALNWQTQQQFAETITACANNPALRSLIITGTGDMFVSGGDIRDQTDQFDQETGQQLYATMGAALRQLTELPVPVIAAINGNAYGGGCEIITACDLRVMAVDAKLHFVHAKMGLTTGWGGAARLIHLVGASQAMQFLLTAQAIDAETALASGLVNQVTTNSDSALDAALALAKRMESLAPNSLGALKQLVWRSADLEHGYAAETELFLKQWSHPNHIEAVNAFLQKRAPRFKL